MPCVPAKRGRWGFSWHTKIKIWGDPINVVKMSQCGFLKKQSSSPINGLLHNPGTNKRIIQTDMSLRTEIIVSNCLIWDFQIYSLCPSRISLNTYHVLVVLGRRNPL